MLLFPLLFSSRRARYWRACCRASCVGPGTDWGACPDLTTTSPASKTFKKGAAAIGRDISLRARIDLLVTVASTRVRGRAPERKLVSTPQWRWAECPPDTGEPFRPATRRAASAKLANHMKLHPLDHARDSPTICSSTSHSVFARRISFWRLRLSLLASPQARLPHPAFHTWFSAARHHRACSASAPILTLCYTLVNRRATTMTVDPRFKAFTYRPAASYSSRTARPLAKQRRILPCATAL
jgi:hypothetical protein